MTYYTTMFAAITISLILCYHVSDAFGTRLPLEVYEIPQSQITSTSHQKLYDPNINYLKHKSLEYDASLSASSLPSLSSSASTVSVTSTTASITDQLDRRRSRQMIDMLQQRQEHRSHELSSQQHKPQQNDHKKETRILYQIGESEEDLPICAPNAVCSKIDLYETPWIERQCRCPEVNRLPNVIFHHKEPLAAGSSYETKFHSYYEKEKLLQHKRLLIGVDFNDKKFESIHLKKLMQKLGAVYQDDLALESNDFIVNTSSDDAEDDDGQQQHISVDETRNVAVNENEFPPVVPRRNSYKQMTTSKTAIETKTTTTTTTIMSKAHMRHSGHSGHKAKEIILIGGCSTSLGIEDGHTIADKTRHYKLCNPVHKLPVCKHFRDYTWTLTTSSEINVTEQIVHCRCPKNSVTYLTKRETPTNGSGGYTYQFACSPVTRIRCQRKEPCKLFTVRKRQEFLDEVNINSLCQCPKGHRCPSHHTNAGVIAGESFLEENIQTYSGYCMAND